MLREIWPLRHLFIACGIAAAWCAPASAAPKLLVANWGQENVLAFDANTGAPLGTFIARGSGGFYRPDEIAVGPNGDVYVAPYTFQAPPAAHKIYRYNGQTGAFVGTLSAPDLLTPRGMTFGSDGNLYVSAAGSGSILKFNPNTGEYLGVFASASLPIGLGFGPDGHLYVANAGTPGSIQRINGATGADMGTFGSQWVDNPQAIAFGPDGKLYVHSQYNHDIVRFHASTGALDRVFYAGQYPYNPSCGMAWGPDGKLYTGNLTGGAANDGVWRFNVNGFFEGYVVPGNGNFQATGVAFTPEPGHVVPALAVAGVLTRRRRIRNLGGRTACDCRLLTSTRASS